MNMFCFQCEQTLGGKGCTNVGVCGKQPESATLQDLIIFTLKGLSFYADKARELGIVDRQTDIQTFESLFTTVTNVNFDNDRLANVIDKTYQAKEKIKKLFLDGYKKKNGSDFNGKISDSANFIPENTISGKLIQGEKVGIKKIHSNEDIGSLKELLVYGLKGTAAYADHAHLLGNHDDSIAAFFYKALTAVEKDDISVDDLVALNMECGKINYKTMEILSNGHTSKFGIPVPTKVSLGVKKGPAILISGHDMPDLEELLIQTEGKGINIYTHGEMIPAHGYPELKKYKHLVGNYGGAWQNQQKEFDEFPGSILMTTNCIQKPRDTYKDRIFTTGLVAWSGVEHIVAVNGKKDFSNVIKKSITLGGFKEDRADKDILVGFGHNAVLSVADKVISGVKSGKIKHFYLIGGCDGAKPGRNYYTEFAEKVSKDSIILTLACGKYRFNKLDFGDIDGIPRLLDIGQCNDSYSAIQIALALSKAFGVGVNELPLSIILSWYEQKAVCVLLTLLSLGIKNIKIGPSLPAFVSPNVLDVLVKNFNLTPISTVENDMK